MLTVLQNLYANDKACIKIDGKISEEFEINQGVRQGCVLSPLLFNIFMSDLPKKLNGENTVSVSNDFSINSLIWADDLLILSETEVGLNSILKCIHEYCSYNSLKINFDKTKCMTFNKTGKLLRNSFYIGGKKLENVRSYKYLGLVFTPSGEIKSALDDLKARALKAYMGLRDKLGICFNTYPDDTIKLFDTIIKPILLYGSDFWGCLSLPKNNPIENLHLMFCKHLLGVQKYTTTDGVLLELGRFPLVLHAQKAAIKNWERIRNGKANPFVTASLNNAENESLDWVYKIRLCLERNGMLNTFINRNTTGGTPPVHEKLFTRLVDIFNQTALSNIASPDSKLRTYNLFKKELGFEPYITCIKNVNHRKALSKFRLSNHQLMIEVGRHKKIPKLQRFCPFCPSPVIEDEIHFLINCPLYDPLRRDIYDICLELKPTLPFYTDEQTFLFMMTSTNLYRVLAKFIHEAMNMRKELLSNTI